MNLSWIDRLNRYGLSKPIMFTLFVISVFGSIVQMIGIGIFIPIFGYIFNKNNSLESESNDEFTEYIIFFIKTLGFDPTIEILLLTSFLLYVISQASAFFISYIHIYYYGKMMKNMRNNFLSYYLDAESEYYDKVKISDVVNITFSELVGAVSGVLAPIKLMVSLVSAIASIAVMFLISYELAFYAILLSIISLGYPILLISRTTEAGRKNSSNNKILTSFLVDRLRSPRLVRLCGTARAEISEYDVLTERQRKLTLNLQLF